MTKEDLPLKQQPFFEKSDGKLQLIFDMNGNGIPEYIICGISDSMLQQGETGAYFIAMFEKTESGLVRRHIQTIKIAPVNIKPSESNGRTGVILTFEFYTDYAAEIFYENEEYHLEKWF